MGEVVARLLDVFLNMSGDAAANPANFTFEHFLHFVCCTCTHVEQCSCTCICMYQKIYSHV